MLLFEGGDVIIALGTDMDKHLLLHSNVLRSASIFLEAGMKPCWTQGTEPPEVTNASTGQKANIFKYTLARHDGVISLQMMANGMSQSINANKPTVPMFLSSFATGFAELRPGDRKNCLSGKADIYLSDVILEHQALFLFLHKIPVEPWLNLSFVNIADIIAYAELYYILPLIAGSIAESLLSGPQIWTDIRQRPAFHLAIAKKIRSEVLFLDALRHFIGSGADWNILVDELDYTRAEAALLVFPKREEVSGRVSTFVKKLERLGLTPSKTTQSNKTTSSIATVPCKGTADAKAELLARYLFNEWLNSQLVNNESMSSHHKSSKEDQLSDIMQSSLCHLCMELVRTTRTGRELELFNMERTKHVSTVFGGGSQSELQAQIFESFKTLVRTASTYAEPLVISLSGNTK